MCARLNPSLRPLLLVAAGATAISFSPVFVTVANVGPTAAAFYRMLFGGAGLVAIVVMRRLPLWGGRRHALLAAACALLLTFDLTVWHTSIGYVGPGLSTILGNFQVFFLAVFGILVLKERLTLRLALGIPLAVLGLFLLFGVRWGELETNYQLGVALGLLTGLLYAAFLLVLRHMQATTTSTPIATLALISVFATVLLWPGSSFVGETLAIPDSQTWAALIGYGIVSQIVGWLLITAGLPGTAASRAGLLLLLQPALAFVWDMLFFQRPISAVEAAGVVLALGAIYLGASRQTGSRAVG